MTESDVRALLQTRVEAAGSQRALAKAIGVSEVFIHQVLYGKRPPSEMILDFLHLERTIVSKRRA